MDLKNIIIRPLITEKSTEKASGENKYSFQVYQHASKNQIKKVVEEFFKVKVKKVRVLNVSGKKHRSILTRRQFQNQNWKKAIVYLAEGDKIDLFEISGEEKEKK